MGGMERGGVTIWEGWRGGGVTICEGWRGTYGRDGEGVG